MLEKNYLQLTDRSIMKKLNYFLLIPMLLNFTNLIKKNTTEVKSDIIEHLWKIIISDNAIDQYESNLMRRICGLIYFPDKMCAEIKLRLLNNK